MTKPTAAIVTTILFLAGLLLFVIYDASNLSTTTAITSQNGYWLSPEDPLVEKLYRKENIAGQALDIGIVPDQSYQFFAQVTMRVPLETSVETYDFWLPRKINPDAIYAKDGTTGAVSKMSVSDLLTALQEYDGSPLSFDMTTELLSLPDYAQITSFYLISNSR